MALLLLLWWWFSRRLELTIRCSTQPLALSASLITGYLPWIENTLCIWEDRGQTENQWLCNYAFMWTYKWFEHIREHWLTLTALSTRALACLSLSRFRTGRLTRLRQTLASGWVAGTPKHIQYTITFPSLKRMCSLHCIYLLETYCYLLHVVFILTFNCCNKGISQLWYKDSVRAQSAPTCLQVAFGLLLYLSCDFFHLEPTSSSSCINTNIMNALMHTAISCNIPCKYVHQLS